MATNAPGLATSSGAARGRESPPWRCRPCPKSPDHLCHYQADDPEAEAPVLTLLDETTIPYPRPHGSYDEFCVYCGEPDERK